MLTWLILSNASIINRDFILERKNIVIDEPKGNISKILDDLPSSDEKVIDCKNRWLFPGLVDIHVHLRDLGQQNKENFVTGSQAAIHGGFTTVFDMPNKIPPINNQLFFQKVRKLAESINQTDIYSYVLVDDHLLAESFNWIYGKIIFGGTTAFSGVEYSILEKVNQLQEKFIAIHAEDKNEIARNEKLYDKNNTKFHNKIRSADAERIAVDKIINFVGTHKNYLNRYHIAHVTLPETVIKINKANLTNLSFEVAPHHMFLSEDDIDLLGDYVKVNPPLRSYDEMMELRNLWINGEVPVLASDHAPHTKEEKIHSKVSGIPSLDTNLRLLTDFCLKSNISPSIITKTFSTNPAILLALNDRGIVEEGKKADLVLVDPNHKEIVEEIYSKCQWSPWMGKTLQGVPICTWKNGKIVYKKESDSSSEINKE